MNFIYTMKATNEAEAREKTLANFIQSKKNIKGEEIGKNDATISTVKSIGDGRYVATGTYIQTEII